MRLYNGCPDDELQSLLDNNERSRRLIKNWGFSVTYFPIEGKYMAFDDCHKPATEFHSTLQGVEQQLREKRRFAK